MTGIRASGGRRFVEVRKVRPSRWGPRLDEARRRSGWIWEWEVPRPKNHPQPPGLETLTGYARTQPEAVTAGLARLRELYEEGSTA